LGFKAHKAHIRRFLTKINFWTYFPENLGNLEKAFQNDFRKDLLFSTAFPNRILKHSEKRMIFRAFFRSALRKIENLKG
jgi:hypothetical protein